MLEEAGLPMTRANLQDLLAKQGYMAGPGIIHEMLNVLADKQYVRLHEDTIHMAD